MHACLDIILRYTLCTKVTYLATSGSSYLSALTYSYTPLYYTPITQQAECQVVTANMLTPQLTI